MNTWKAVLFTLLIGLFLFRPSSLDAAPLRTVTLLAGNVLNVKASDCSLQLARNKTTVVRVQCVELVPQSARTEIAAPTGKIILQLGESVKILGNACRLIVLDNTTSLVRVKCYAVGSYVVSAFSENYYEFAKNNKIFCKKTGGGGGGRGLNVAVLNLATGALEGSCRNFDTWSNHANFIAFANFLDDIPIGKLVMIAIADEGGFIQYAPPQSGCHTPFNDPAIETGYQALENLGSTKIRQVGYWGSWAMITIKGSSTPLAEAFHDPMYNSPVGGFCQLKARTSTRVTVKP